MLWQIDEQSSRPLFEQVAANVRRELAAGHVRKGDRLPAAREVADSLGINVHTVLRAYQDLRDQGLIELRRGRGAIVVATTAHAGLSDQIEILRAEAARLGLSKQELAALILGED